MAALGENALPKIRDWCKSHFGAHVSASTTTEKATISLDTGADTSLDTVDIPAATTTKAGVMTSSDKAKLDGIASGANAYAHPAYAAKASGLYKTTVDATGHVSAAAAVTKADITALGIPGSDTNTTYGPMTGATASAAGAAGLVPAPVAGDNIKFLSGAGAWRTPADHTNLSVGSTNLIGDGETPIAVTSIGPIFLTPGLYQGQSYFAIGINAATSSSPGSMSKEDKAKLDAFGAASTYAPKASPALTGTPKAPTAAAGTNTTQVATTAFVANAVAAAQAGAATYKGAANAASAIEGSAYVQGWYWVIGTAGTYVGEACEAGDMVFCNTSKGSGGYSAAHFDIVQSNISFMTDAEVLAVLNAA